MADGVILGQQAVTLPTGNTAARPTASAGMMRLNTETFAAEIYQDGSWVPFASKQDGTSESKAIASTSSLAAAYSTFGYTGQNRLWIKNNSGTAVQTDTYKDGNGNVWYLICGIGDSTSSGTTYTTWYNNGSWTGSNTFGTLTSANLEYKNSLYFNSSYSDILVMQGRTSGAISSDWYGNSDCVAYTSNQFLSTRGSKLSSFLSGTSGPDVRTNGASGRVQISCTFLKGSAATSKSYYYSPNSQDELSATNVFDFGGQNNEGYRCAMVNALGCQQNGVNLEHYSWSADVGGNYAARNFWGTNYGSPWGVNPSNGSHWYWLFWAK